MNNHAQRLAEIKARAEAAEAPYVDDVPFLLEQLKTWRMTSAVFEKAAESAQAKLAASEAAAGQMVEALEMIMERSDEGSRFHSACEAALATDAGKGWLSPEEAERLRKGYDETTAAMVEDPLRSHGLVVSEEECARRCREVAIEYAGAMPYQPLGDLAAIIDRVAKGGAR